MSASPSAFDYTQVTKENFAEAYVNIVDKVACTDYIAIATEFTGYLKNPDDNVYKRYVQMRKNVNSHSLVSTGITIITKKDVGNGAPEYHFDNFELLLRNVDKFTVEPSLLWSLARNGFDFNRLLLVDLPYRQGKYMKSKERTGRDMIFEVYFMSRRKESRSLCMMGSTI